MGVAVWERMLKKLVENGQIVSKRSYWRKWWGVGWPRETTYRGQQESGLDGHDVYRTSVELDDEFTIGPARPERCVRESRVEIEHPSGVTLVQISFIGIE